MSTISAYEAFEIHLECPPEGGYRLKIRSPAGQTSVALEEKPLGTLKELFPSPTSEGTRDLGWVAAPSNEAPKEAQSPEERGRALYNLLFPKEVEQLFDQNLENLLPTPHRGLCIRLHFDLEDRRQAELARLPWELMFREDTRRFLAHSIETPIVRYLDLPGKVPRFVLPQRLRILLVVSEPRDLPPLDGLLQEVEKIRTSWEQDNVLVEVLRYEEKHSTDLGARLRESLRSGEFHVLHFMGHGSFDELTQEGVLFLEGVDRRSLRVSGENLANWLINHRSLRLVVLNACSTGQLRDERPFAGVASALVRAGIPGVFAMQAPMLDTMAVEFGRILYHQLADGAPVEAALAEARLELHAASPAKSAAWSTPVLLQRTPQIVEVPPKIGPALASAWTVLGSLHLLWVGLMFLRNRSLIPGLDSLLQGDVAAFLGVFFGLPLFAASLYCAIEFAKITKLPVPAAELRVIRRTALRLPVAFKTRIQGRRANEIIYQIVFLVLLVLAPAALQGYLFIRMVNADVWLHREPQLYSTTWQESFFNYMPPREAFLGDRYRLGSIDTRTGVKKVINNITYFPFWEAWGLLLAELFSLGLVLYLLLKLTEGSPPTKDSRSRP